MNRPPSGPLVVRGTGPALQSGDGDFHAAGDVEQAALALPQIAHQLAGRAPKKIVVVPNRIVNLVA